MLVGTSAFSSEAEDVGKRRATTSLEQIQFEVLADAIFSAPQRGERSLIDISLRITNHRDEALRFSSFDTITISLTDPEGRVLPADGGRDGTRPGTPLSSPVQPGESLLMSRAAELVWTEETNLRLVGDDGFGGIWYVDGLRYGVHALRVSYQNRSSRGAGDTPIWTGKAIIPNLNVEVK